MAPFAVSLFPSIMPFAWTQTEDLPATASGEDLSLLEEQQQQSNIEIPREKE
eukprot:CAMPEP_0178729420 /NCGR_PEP_ID=MMETSP0699-20121125/28961_1 /TAXON_ID=265572 /ORGANISM="Extubocellulus spinifer, Strain CCMP396" /LENGTH=51 /DNA_ID=CAMNT_0020381347 /DNA_START=209 /DNA_END=361 /DNA_ORIENTATION=-